MDNGEDEKEILINYSNNLLQRYLHAITNFQTIDVEMINMMLKMSDEEKTEIIKTFNNMIQLLKYLLEE